MQTNQGAHANKYATSSCLITELLVAGNSKDLPLLAGQSLFCFSFSNHLFALFALTFLEYLMAPIFTLVW
jgi:hypothetical protein